MPQSARRFASDLFQALNSHDLDRAEEFYSAGYVGDDIGQSGPQEGRRGIRASLSRLQSAFPDVSFSLDDSIFDGNRIVVAWTAKGTHRGTIMNIPATGHLVAVRGVSLLTLENGKISRGTHLWDVAGLLRSVGLLPEL